MAQVVGLRHSFLALRTPIIGVSSTRYAARNSLLLYERCILPSLGSSQARCYQRPPEKQGLFGRFVDNIKEGMNKNKEMQDNIKRFQEEAKRMEESESLKSAKEQMSVINKFKAKLDPIRQALAIRLSTSSKVVSSKAEQIYQDATESDVFKKSQEIKDELKKTAQETAEMLSKQGEELEKMESYKVVSKGIKTVHKELLSDIAAASKPYQRPDQLRRRTVSASASSEAAEKVFDPDTDTMGVVLHKESKWSQQWKDFKDNNTVVNGLFTLKMKYDESDHVMIRATRFVTDKFGDIFSDVFSQSDTAATLVEIAKIDPNFSKEEFLRECEFEIIPTVLEAYLRGDIDILQDWCHEAAFNVLSTQIKHNKANGIKLDSKILDIRDVDIVMAKVMEQGPVLVLAFVAQQTMVATDKTGMVIEGDEGKIESVQYIWALCRDQSIYDPRAAWRLLEFAVQQATPWV